MSTRVVKLTVITDFICYHCCSGQHELLNAISHCKDVLNLPLSFELEHVPFILIAPNAVTKGVDRAAFFEKILGKEKFENTRNAITKWSNEKGVKIHFNGVMSQSLTAHRLCQKAYKMGGQKLQLPFLIAVFKAFMEEQKDISDFDVLGDLADSVGLMTKDEAKRFLESDELEKEVIEMHESAKSKGVTGVPMTIIDGKWAVCGTQSSDVYIQIFQKLAREVFSSPPRFSPAVVGSGILA